MRTAEKGRIRMERKHRAEEVAIGLVRRGKSHPESVEEAGRRVKAGQVEVKEDNKRMNWKKMEG